MFCRGGLGSAAAPVGLTDVMVDFVVYVDWPQEGARDDALRSINDAWPQDDESFCSSMEADVVELSFGLAAASYEEALAWRSLESVSSTAC